MVLTRATLVGVSSSCIGIVVDTLIHLLEELSRPYKGIHSHPIHVLHSELYVIELLAECCTRHWRSLNSDTSEDTSNAHDPDSDASDSEQDSKGTTQADGHEDQRRRASRNRLSDRNVPPEPLDSDLVRRVVEAIKLFLRPISEDYVLPVANILDDEVFKGPLSADVFPPDMNPSIHGQYRDPEALKFVLDKNDAIEAYTREILEYVSYSNWSRILDFLKTALQQAAHQPTGNTVQGTAQVDEERNILITLRMISSFRVDSRKLGIVIQELCGCFLHLRKSFQTTIAIVLPLLITRWLETNPKDFVALHSTRKRLDGGAETLFDMTNSMFESGKRKALLFPLQTALLLLLPDVFEVASHMREIKSSGISKKVSFLESLRKSLRSRNETAIFCLTGLLMMARHFPLDSDAAFLSYALDVQEEVREAVFRNVAPGTDFGNIEHSLMSTTFISLAHLNFEGCIENLAPLCLSASAPQDFKIAVISACSHFARQSNYDEYQPLFIMVSEFIRSQLKV